LSAGALPSDYRAALCVIDSLLNVQTAQSHEGRGEVLDDLPYADIDSLPEGSIDRLLVSAKISRQHGANALSLASLNDALGRIDLSDRRFSYVARQISEYYGRYDNKHDDMLYYLALAAISEVEIDVQHSPSLALTGRELLRRGDYDRGTRYILFAARTEDFATLDDDVDISVIEGLNDIYDHSQALHRKHHLAFASVIFGLLIAIFLVTTLYLRTYRKLLMVGRRNDRLDFTNGVQGEAVKQIFMLCESYIENNDDFMRLVMRKIKTGQAQDLYKSIESGKAQAERVEHFNATFDELFYRIFPTFKEQVNALLQDDKQIVSGDGAQLTAELRILAFMRLGIDDAAKLSKFLGLSVNTVYTYRNKVKSKARNRADFEAEIMKIS
jgi:DNA-binding CsgD family transcriptional regulator